MSQIVIEDPTWKAIMADPQLERARRKLSFHEIRLIIQHARDSGSRAKHEDSRSDLNRARAALTPPASPTGEHREGCSLSHVPLDLAPCACGRRAPDDLLQRLENVLSFVVGFVKTLPSDCMGMNADVRDFYTGEACEPYPIRDEWLADAEVALGEARAALTPPATPAEGEGA